ESGGGITSLNGLEASAQSFAVGTGGADFGVTSSGSTHTFHLPTASATTRGALSSADWSAFDAKAEAAHQHVEGDITDLTHRGAGSGLVLTGADLGLAADGVGTEELDDGTAAPAAGALVAVDPLDLERLAYVDPAAFAAAAHGHA